MARIRILIADDHPVVRRGLRSLIEAQSGWEIVAEVGNGREAVQLAKRLKPDVAIVDITMPELNGLDAAVRIIRAAPRTEVLVLTMHTSEQLARDVLRTGARGFLLKSDADAKLIDAIETLSRHKPFLTPNVAELVLNRFIEQGEQRWELDAVGRLTSREREVIQLLTEGRSNKQVAVQLGISVKTAEAHRANIMRKLNLNSLSELVRYAIRNKIVLP